jgi:hypothetical protein
MFPSEFQDTSYGEGQVDVAQSRSVRKHVFNTEE